ncbi:hypothetical protein CEXT_452441 [Caerostris extrusa]|uniref:Uncharacterized protein n=1 Tax=Caerostris extrusa TaxID=172846 RepID=A0AAV4TEL0_CAEEX|nr:hypothetical protein CEXT_452441 [Caerostris extrusa]
MLESNQPVPNSSDQYILSKVYGIRAFYVKQKYQRITASSRSEPLIKMAFRYHQNGTPTNHQAILRRLLLMMIIGSSTRASCSAMRPIKVRGLPVTLSRKMLQWTYKDLAFRTVPRSKIPTVSNAENKTPVITTPLPKPNRKNVHNKARVLPSQGIPCFLLTDKLKPVINISATNFNNQPIHQTYISSLTVPEKSVSEINKRFLIILMNRGITYANLIELPP